MSAGLLEQCPACFRYGRLCASHRAASARRHAASLRGLAAAIEAVRGDVTEIVEDLEDCEHAEVEDAHCVDCGECVLEDAMASAYDDAKEMKYDD